MTKNATQILLIEDDLCDAEIVQRALENSEIPTELVWVKTVAQGIENLRSRHFDLVLSDLGLPDYTGEQTIAVLREHTPHTPLVILSGNNDSFAAKYIAAGADEYLLKSEISDRGLLMAIFCSMRRHEHSQRIKDLLAEVKSQSSSLEQKNTKLAALYSQAHEFVDNVSHEFRTPLTVVKEYISLVREGLAGEVNEEQARMLSIAEDRADDLNTMVEDMLDISKLEAGMLGAWRKTCRPEQVVERVRDTLRRKAAVKQVEMNWAVPTDLPPIYCDAEKVGRVITNLAVNAIKFSGRSGAVTVGAESDLAANEVIFWVRDNGPGIDEVSLTAIFDRFKQLGQSIRSSTKGFGLGLNIAKELVELNFGQMSVASKLGEGCQFSFSVPFSNATEVINRFADRTCRVAELENREQPVVSLIQASVEQEISEDMVEEVDAFLNYCLRRNDLLFRSAKQQWLIAMPEGSAAVDLLMNRVKTELESVNRNRPFGPLPEVIMDLAGTWQLPQERASVIESLSHIVAYDEIETVELATV